MLIMKRYCIILISVFFIVGSLLLNSCSQTPVPKPRGYFRIDFPQKEYRTFTSECNYSFQYPVYAEVKKVNLANAEPCWYDLEFTGYKATLHLTYKPLKDNLSSYVEDIRRIVNKHIIKADDIIETPIYNKKGVYGLLYDIKGNTASAVNFYITDSVTGFLSGSLYFNVRTNKDSLAPAIQFFRQDIVHLINTFSWE